MGSSLNGNILFSEKSSNLSLSFTWTYLSNDKACKAYDEVQFDFLGGTNAPSNQTVDCGLESLIQIKGYEPAASEPVSISPTTDWTRWCLESLKRVAHDGEPYMRKLFLLLPHESGYVIRNDIFDRKLRHCPLVSEVFSALLPCQHIRGSRDRFRNDRWTASDINSLFDSAVCGVLSVPITRISAIKSCEEIQYQLQNRLSLPWTISHQPARRTLALLGAGSSYKTRQDLFQIAKSLCIDLVVLSRRGSWLETAASDLGVTYIQVDTQLDDGLPERLASALRNHHVRVEGIMTLADPYIIPVATAAQYLGLPSPDCSDLQACIDKAVTRRMAPINGNLGTVIRKAEPIPKSITQESFPIIAKPRRGHASQGVFKVNEFDDLKKACDTIFGFGEDILLEPYIDGPEVDVNIVLKDGQVIFAETSDSRPCTAEGFSHAQIKGSFMETGCIFPSCLPVEEVDLLEKEVGKLLIDLGFHTGIFHTEARVQNSRMSYGTSCPSQQPEISLTATDPTGRPQVAIMEINARSPGSPFAAGSSHAFGVDYFAIQMIAALGNDERLKYLAVPYKTGSIGWTEVAFVPAETGGLYRPTHMFRELCSSAPDLMNHVCRWVELLEPGDCIPDPETTGKFRWVAWFMVWTDKGRSHLSSVTEEVRKRLAFSITPSS